LRSKLTYGQKIGWGLADMGIVVFVIVKQLLILSFLTNYLGINVAIAGALTTSILIFDILTDPIIGYLSDRTESRWGRRAPWMAIGALLLAFGQIGIFGVPIFASQMSILIWVAVFFALSTLGFTMVAIPYGASAGEMTYEPKERSSLMGFRMAFASMGILIGGAIIPQLAGGTKDGHFFASAVIAPVIIIAIWTSIWATRKAPKETAPSHANLRNMALLVYQNKPFMRLVLLYGLMTMAIATITAGLPFAAIYLIFDGEASFLSTISKNLGILSFLFAAFVIGAMCSQVFWVFLSNILGKSAALIAGLGAYIILLFILFYALPSTNITTMFILFLLAGVTNGAYQQIPWAMYPDLMDQTRVDFGEAIEGAFSAVWLFGQKVANAIAPGFLAIILGIYGFQSSTMGKIEQPDQALTALKVMVTLVPAAFLFFAILGLISAHRREK
jgi:GPH family glycoside/pentoside/hexuronide:cation symporter